jgi:hypothetical protein
MVRFRRFPAETLLSAAIWLAGALAVFVSPSARGAAVMIMAADDPPPPKSAVSDSAPTNFASKPMIIQNSDGTFTIQKEPANGNSKDAKGEKGLVIPPQVIVPEVRRPERKN